MKYLLMNLFSYMILLLFILMGIAFLTLLERKFLGYIQMRKGPNKVGLMGSFQPFSDALKLFSKEIMFLNKSNMLFVIIPLISIFLMFMIWMVVPNITNIYFMNFSILVMILIVSLNSYLILLMGWVSNSLYSMIGSIRLIVQILSYEVSFIMILLVQMILSESYSIFDLMKWQFYLKYVVLLIPLFFIFFISLLVELSRMPSDFIESESELVSGFNVEYFSGLFGLIFMGEYGMIIFMSVLMEKMYFSMNLVFLILLSLIIFMRGILPRMRYDELMYLCWKIILPVILNYLVFIFLLKIYLTLLL